MNNNLYNLREAHDLLQKDVAEIMNIHQRTYSSWETNSKIIPLKHLNTICNYYNVSMDYILKLTENKTYNDMQYKSVLNKKEVGSRIKKLREENHISLRTLAKELNTTPSTISAYENGKTLILTAFAFQLCKQYNISIDWLVGKREYKYRKIKK